MILLIMWLTFNVINNVCANIFWNKLIFSERKQWQELTSLNSDVTMQTFILDIDQLVC